MTVQWLFLTELCYFFYQFYCFPKIAVTDCIIYSGAQPMYYDSPKLLLTPHSSQWRSVFVWILKRPPGQHMSAKFPTIFSFPGSQHRLKLSTDIAPAPCIDGVQSLIPDFIIKLLMCYSIFIRIFCLIIDGVQYLNGLYFSNFSRPTGGLSGFFIYNLCTPYSAFLNCNPEFYCVRLKYVVKPYLVF